MRSYVLSAALICAACSSEAPQSQRMPPSPTPQCAAGGARACSCAGAPGTQACAADGTWAACACGGGAPLDVDNPTEPTPRLDAGSREPAAPARDCSPGLYLGTYACEIALFGFLPVPLAGDVSFNLSINETTIDRNCDGEEFCEDLVISENGGTLFGLAGLVGFETKLTGALDCTTGEFRASGLGGRWGNAISTDPSDPNALWTVEDPPFGMFEGELMGTHAGASAGETIAGEWNLRETAMDITCAGPFNVTLQP